MEILEEEHPIVLEVALQKAAALALGEFRQTAAQILLHDALAEEPQEEDKTAQATPEPQLRFTGEEGRRPGRQEEEDPGGQPEEEGHRGIIQSLAARLGGWYALVVEKRYLRMIERMRPEGPKDWSVYIARCVDGTYYTGVAKDVAARLATHN